MKKIFFLIFVLFFALCQAYSQGNGKMDNNSKRYDKFLCKLKQLHYDAVADYCLIFQIDNFIEQYYGGDNYMKYEILTALNIKSGYSELCIGDDYYIGVEELPVNALSSDDGITYASMRKVKGETNNLLHRYPQEVNKKERFVKYSSRIFNLDTSTVSFMFDNKKLAYQRKSKDYYSFANCLINSDLGLKLDFDDAFIHSISKYYQKFPNDSLKVFDIYRMVRDNVVYKTDVKDTDEYKAPLLTMLDKTGDCEDYATLICALGSLLTNKYFFIVKSDDHGVAAFSDSASGEIESLTFCDATDKSLILGYKTIRVDEIIKIIPYE